MEEKDRILIETEARSKSNLHRIDHIEQQLESLHSLALAVQKIAINTEAIAAEQKRQGARLDELEAKPRKNHEAIIKGIITAFTSAVVGALITALVTIL